MFPLFLAQDPILPNSQLTPGDIIPNISVEVISVPGYTKKIRNVPKSIKSQVYAEYGLERKYHFIVSKRGKQVKVSDYEVDHLISLELGGSNDIKNLWPQSYLTQPWNAHVKDILENRLHAMVRRNQITLSQAQQEIASNWIEAFKKYCFVPGPTTTPKPWWHIW